MRWTDLYLGLLGAVAAFGAVALHFAGASWWPVAGLAVLAAIMLVSMLVVAAHEERVLLVGDPRGSRLNRTKDAIDEAGFATVYCPGPEVQECPAMHGQPCPVHDRIEAVLISTSDAYTGPIPPCGEALHVGAAQVETPDAVARALDELVARAA